MAKGIVVLNTCLGLNNKVDPVRIKFDPESGISELAVAVDIDIDSSGRISRRKGYERVLSGAGHSLFPYNNICFVVVDSSLTILYPDFSTKTLLQVTDARMSYCAVGTRVYFANSYEKGYIENEVVYPWEKGSYVGPDTTKVLYDPPVGKLLEVWNGRMFVDQDEALWYSEAFNYHAFALGENYILFPSKLRMVKAVKDGLFVSTEEETYFLSGSTPKSFSQLKVADYPAIEGTDVLVKGSKIGGDDLDKGILNEDVVIWTSSEGICIGGPGGFFKNLTERKLTYPSAKEGAGLCIDDRYISVLKAPDLE